MQELISIIVPIYNSADYLPVCIDSILNQTYENIEVILVNNKSTDDSEKICQEYAKANRKITYLNVTDKQGAGPARNAGIDIARGKYLLFIDSDDHVALNYVEELHRLIEISNCNMSVCQHKPVYNLQTIQTIEKSTLNEFQIMDSEEAIKNMCYQRGISPGPFCKLYKKELFDSIRFPNSGYEDLAVIYKVLDTAGKVAFSPVEKYYYVQRKSNTTLGYFNDAKLDRLKVVEDMKDFIQQYYPNLINGAYTRCFLAAIQTLNVIPFKMFSRKYRELIQEYIIRYRKPTLINHSAKFSIRIIALCSYLGIIPLKCLGKIYNILCGQYKVRLK